jgi:hypothetical protein
VPRPTEAQRAILEQLSAGAVLRMPPWSKRIMLISSGTGGPTPTVSGATFRVFCRHAWIVLRSDHGDQVPTYALSEAGRAALR